MSRTLSALILFLFLFALPARANPMLVQSFGVKPTYEKLNGQDPVAYIISANLARRNMSKGQMAMALAMICEPEKGGRGKLSTKKGEFNKYMENRVSQARTILRLAKQFDAEKGHEA